MAFSYRKIASFGKISLSKYFIKLGHYITFFAF